MRAFATEGPRNASPDAEVIALLAPAALALAVVLALGGALFLALLPAVHRPLACIAVLSAAAVALTRHALPRTPPRHAHAVGTALATIALANACLFLVATADPRATALIAAVPLACSWVFLSRGWLLATAAVTLVALASALQWVLPMPSWERAAAELVALLALGALVHETRLRARRRLDDARRQAAGARSELEHDLEAARGQAAHLRQLADASPEGVILHESGRILDANRAALELLGRSLPDLKQHSLSSLLARDRSEPAEALLAFERPFETNVLLHDGTSLPVELRTDTVALDGRLASALILRDITLRRRERAALATRRSLETLVTRMAAEFVRLPPRLLEQGIEQAIEAIGRLIGADHGHLLQLSENGGLRLACEWYAAGVPRPPGNAAVAHPQATPWLSRRIAALEAVHIPDLASLPPQAATDKAYLGQHGVKTLVTVPIAYGDRILGTLSLAALQRHRTWTDETVALLRIAGEILASALTRQRALQDLETSEARKAAILEAALDCIITLDARGCVVECNPAAEKTFGCAGAVGRPVRDLILPARLRRGDTDDLGVLFGGAAGPRLGKRIEITACRADGNEFPAEVAVVPMTANGEAAFTLTLRDITDRREIDRLREELIATVSHELRTPLTSLRGFAELMLERDFPHERRQKYLRVICNEAHRLTQLVNDFLDLKRIEGGHATLRLERVDLRSLLRETHAVFHREDGLHTFHLDLDPVLPLVDADPAQILRLLSNLVSNAVKFSPHGGDVTLGVRSQADGVVLWVRDQGIGIPPEAMDRLFGKFYRVDNAETRSIGGTGLGLALVKEIAAAHGGRVWVESTPGCGSTFSVLIPASPADAASTSEAVLAAQRHADWPLLATGTDSPMEGR